MADSNSAMEEDQDGKKVFRCKICNKTFKFNNGLVRHVRLIHVGEKPFECNICKKRFGYKHTLMEHQNLHYGNKPYVCSVCNKRFAARSNWVMHRSVHKKPFSCTICAKNFENEQQLKKHLFAHPQVMLHCSICQYAAPTPSELNAHMLELHPPSLINMEEKAPKDRRRSSDSASGSSHHGEILPQEQLINNTISELQQSPPPLNYTSVHLNQVHGAAGNKVDGIAERLSQSAASASAIGTAASALMSIKKEIDNYQDYRNEVAVENNEPNTPSANGGLLSPSDVEKEVEVETTKSVSPDTSRPESTSTGATTMANDTSPLQRTPLPGIDAIFSKPRTNAMSNMNMAQQIPTSFGTGGFAMPALPPPDQHPNQRPPMYARDIFPLGFPHPGPLSPTLSASQALTNQALSALGDPRFSIPQAKEVRDVGVQHTVEPVGMPNLEDVLNHYVLQGRIFKCIYCNILFFERGIYFLHASLHAPNNPWECNICHKLCNDRNEFTLHFVNQQHTS